MSSWTFQVAQPLTSRFLSATGGRSGHTVCASLVQSTPRDWPKRIELVEGDCQPEMGMRLEMNYVQRRILVVGVVVLSLGLVIVPWTSPREVLISGRPRTSGAYPTEAYSTPVFLPQPPQRHDDSDKPVYRSSGYCLIFAMPQGASISWGRMWPPLAVVVMGTTLGLYLAHGQDKRTPFYGDKPPSA
jgi:hypothetical protein